MSRSVITPFGRICVALCLALTLLFAAASAANAVNRLQHLTNGSAEHHHLPLADISVDEDGDHHPDMGDPDNDMSRDHQPGTGHHHHGDNGSSLAIFGDARPLTFAPGSVLHPVRADRSMLGLAVRGPERPPRPAIFSV